MNLLFVCLMRKVNSMRVVRNLAFFDASAWDCVVHADYELGAYEHERLSRCRVRNRSGYAWGSSILSERINDGYAYVALLLDDVRIRTLHVPSMVSLMRSDGIHVASPRVRNSHYSFMQRAHGRELLSVPMVEIFLAVFSLSAWTCLNGMLKQQARYFRHVQGWGFDVCYAAVCHEHSRTSLFTRFEVVHTGPRVTRSAANRRSRQQMVHLKRWVMRHHNRSCLDDRHVVVTGNESRCHSGTMHHCEVP